MINTSDGYNREVALEKALLFWTENKPASDEQVMKTAEKFRAFLAGEGAKPEPFKAELPKFKLPRIGDGYVYYRFNGGEWILYRSDLAAGALAPSVTRISLRSQREWKPVHGELSTRQALRSTTDDYTCIPASRARELAEKYIKGSELV